MKRKLLAGLLTLCMAAGMAVPAAAATTPAEQEQGADGPKYTHWCGIKKVDSLFSRIP